MAFKITNLYIAIGFVVLLVLGIAVYLIYNVLNGKKDAQT